MSGWYGSPSLDSLASVLDIYSRYEARIDEVQNTVNDHRESQQEAA